MYVKITRHQSYYLRCVVALLVGLIMPFIQGCSNGPTGFETYELNYRDSLRVELPGQQTIIVLEQVSDGPVNRYADVAYDVNTSNESDGSILLLLDVVGLVSTPTPMIYKETRQQGDTLFVWYADEPRENVVGVAGKQAVSSGIQTTPPELYVKVRHVTIEAPSGMEVEFSNRFVR